jgi:hypothetical protein
MRPRALRVRRGQPKPLLDHGVDRGVAVVAVGQHRDRCPAVGQQGQAGGGPLGEGEVGDGPAVGVVRAVSAVHDHRRRLAVMPSGASTSACMESANGRPVSSSTSSCRRL